MKSIQEIAEETRELLYNLRTGATRIDKEDCSETLWDLRDYLADDDLRECLDRIIWDIAHDPREPLDDIDEDLQPITQHNTNTLWEWLIKEQSHVRLVGRRSDPRILYGKSGKESRSLRFDRPRIAKEGI